MSLSRSFTLAGLLGLALFASSAPAAINPGGIVNGASYRSPKFPGSGVAKGSIFIVFGSDLADAGLQTATSFPLQSTMGGASIQVSVGGTTVDCLMIYTTPGQVAALLPSAAAEGTGTLTLRHSGQTFTEPITVVAHSPGIFSQNSQGSGPASLTNFTPNGVPPVNQLDQALTADQYGIVWLTGLGGVSGDEAVNPGEAGTIGDLRSQYDIKLYVGGKPAAEILYAGRSGCCSGVDQIAFKPAAGVVGCYVPVVVTVNGVPSNYTSVSIASSGSVCSEPGLFDATQLSTALGSGEFRVGVVDLIKVTADLGFGGFSGDIEAASADFQSFNASSYRQSSGNQQFLPVNSCLVFTFTGESGDFSESIPYQGLNAGTVTVQGPNGIQTLDMAEVGTYFKSFLQPSIPTIPGIPQTTSYLTPGTYTFAATGGSGVGAFSTSRTYSGGITWTNKDAISNVPRGQGLTVTWSGGNANEEYAYISGTSVGGIDLSALAEEGKLQESDQAYGAAFFCQADASLGSFTVGPEVLAVLPPSQSISTPVGTFGTGQLQVGSSSKPQEFNAPMLDLGVFVYQRATSKFVDYK